MPVRAENLLVNNHCFDTDKKGYRAYSEFVMPFSITSSEKGFFGNCVSEGGNKNNNGHDDIIIGDPYADDGGVYAECAYLYFERNNLNTTGLNPSSSNSKLVGEESDDNQGWSIAGGS